MGVITYGASLQNEVKAWPPLVQIGAGFDLVTQNHWWDDVGTPTTKATAVPVSGEAGLTAAFLEVIKCITDAVNEGFMQRYTYADEPRVKSGKTISAAIWVGSVAGSVDSTVKLVNSDASETVGTLVATVGDFDLYVVEAHVCAGTYVDLQVTKDTSGTFYAGGNITVMVGADAVELPPRGLVLRWKDGVLIKSLTGLGDEATWTDIDCTVESSNLAAVALTNRVLSHEAASQRWELHYRRNGSSDGTDNLSTVGLVSGDGNEQDAGQTTVLLDDQQIFEYFLDRTLGSATLTFGTIGMVGYWEWV